MEYLKLLCNKSREFYACILISAVCVAYEYNTCDKMFASPAKNSAQCTDVQSKLHSIWEQSDVKTNLLQLSSFMNLSIITE